MALGGGELKGRDTIEQIKLNDFPPFLNFIEQFPKLPREAVEDEGFRKLYMIILENHLGQPLDHLAMSIFNELCARVPSLKNCKI
jgi:hypothetical protein